MIVYVQGKVLQRGLQFLDVLVQGIGYRVFTTEGTASRVPLGDEVALYTHQHVREDAIQLFGFLTSDERECFELLLTVSGIGPKGALQIVGAMPLEKLAAAVLEERLDVLCQLPGIGKKTAQRLILDLKDKLSGWISLGGASDVSLEPIEASPSSTLEEDTLIALRGLGFSEAEARRAIVRALKSEKGTVDVRELLRLSLRELQDTKSHA